jgi:UDP-2-acetamido-2-deoxy-ribo-hexuluronate aminotransferase
MKIPFFGIDRFYHNHSREILTIIDDIYKHGEVLMGPNINEFEKKISEICKRKYAVAVGSCTDALFFSLLSKGIGDGDEVIVTGFSFIASAIQIIRVGAIPVFIDIDPDFFMMDISKIKDKITPKTKAIIAVHLFGQTLDFDKVEEIAKENNLFLIEDAAQSIGSFFNNKPAGSLGDVSCISFDPTKIIGAFGNGGVLLTDNKEIFHDVVKFRYHGKNMTTGEFESFGINSRLATSQAGLLNFQLDMLNDLITRRKQIASYYSQELSKIEHIKVPLVNKGSDHIYHKYVIKIENQRNDLKDHLKNLGISTMIHYQKALFDNPVFKNYLYIADDISVIDTVKNQVLSLPIYPELSDNEVEYIVSKTKMFFSVN